MNEVRLTNGHAHMRAPTMACSEHRPPTTPMETHTPTHSRESTPPTESADAKKHTCSYTMSPTTDGPGDANRQHAAATLHSTRHHVEKWKLLRFFADAANFVRAASNVALR